MCGSNNYVKTLKFFNGDIKLIEHWDCGIGSVCDVYDETGKHLGLIPMGIDNINENNFEILASDYNIDWE